MLGRRIVRTDRGDTLIEVLFAFSILSLVIIGAMAIMNQGTIASQRSLEITLVRQQIDAQATTLRFLHDAYVAKFQPNGTYDPTTPAGQWATMSAAISATSASSMSNLAACPTTLPGASFILDTANAKYLSTSTGQLVPSTTFSQVTYDAISGTLKQAEGIWIEAIRSVDLGDINQKNTRFIDFHINACWENPGQGPPMTIATIVRLYEPQS